MNAQLPITEDVHLMVSDSVPGFGPALSVGNNCHIVIVANDKAEADRAFGLLSAGGDVTMPIANAPWGPYFGMCRDKFGTQWMVSLDHAV
jgi:PhnB protein